jgi:hypothetical protein
MEVEKGWGNHDWKIGEMKASGGDWIKANGKIRKTTTPGPPSLKGATLRKPNL